MVVTESSSGAEMQTTGSYVDSLLYILCDSLCQMFVIRTLKMRIFFFPRGWSNLGLNTFPGIICK